MKTGTYQNRYSWTFARLESKLMRTSKQILCVVLIGMSMILSVKSPACPPPPCTSCWGNWPDCDVWKCTGCTSCEGTSCMDDDDKCTDCKTCDYGVCVGGCVECEICVEWSPGFYDCDHLCMYCDPPEYCDGCRCVECSLGTTPDTSTCSSSNDTSCPFCDTGPDDACSDHTIKEYQDASLYDCTGADCNEIEEICYIEYDVENGPIWGSMLCYSTGNGPDCNLNLEFPSWCQRCQKDTADPGTPNPETSHSCPPEQSWP